MTDSEIEITPISEVVQNVNLSSTDTSISRPDIPFLQEQTRTWLAITLIVGLEITFGAIGVFIYFTEDQGIKRELITLVLTSEVTLVSSALGFYFGSKGN
jgi:hypothetical protein